MEVHLRSGILRLSVAASALSLAVGAGCAGKKPAPKRVEVDPVRERAWEVEKPMPGDRSVRREVPQPPFDDVPLVTQRPPEQRAYVEAYEAVGRPRIAVLVSRGPEGSSDEPPVDYGAIEMALTDWLSADGRVEVLSPNAARQRLRGAAPKEGEGGAGGAAGAREPDVDVLVEVLTRPVRRTSRGMEYRVSCEAVNVRDGGRSIARAMVEVPPPLDKPQLNKYTRFLGRKMMDGMTTFWQSMSDAERGAGDRPAGPRAAPEGEPPRSGAEPQ
ncbi:MAG TPA: hypothetical protein VFB66_21080 [Tepidisphaeraceae bacterium]|nr:hypothetical protein [Tepidisphaeraceae bacterium]